MERQKDSPYTHPGWSIRIKTCRVYIIAIGSTIGTGYVGPAPLLRISLNLGLSPSRCFISIFIVFYFGFLAFLAI